MKKKFTCLLTALIAGSLCAGLTACSTPPPGDDNPPSGELTQAELAVVYENAANSAYDKTGITNPNAPCSGVL